MSTTTELTKEFERQYAKPSSDDAEACQYYRGQLQAFIAGATYQAGRSAAHGEPSVIHMTTTPVVVDFESSAAKYRTDIVKALHEAGAPLCHEDGHLMSAVEQIQWLASRVREAGSAEQVSEREIKTWTDRVDWSSSEPAAKLMVEAMKAEIAELRAALTAPAPSTAGEWTDEQVDILRRAAEILEHDCGRPHNANELRALLSAPAQAQSEEAK